MAVVWQCVVEVDQNRSGLPSRARGGGGGGQKLLKHGPLRGVGGVSVGGSNDRKRCHCSWCTIHKANQTTRIAQASGLSHTLLLSHHDAPTCCEHSSAVKIEPTDKAETATLTPPRAYKAQKNKGTLHIKHSKYGEFAYIPYYSFGEFLILIK